MLRKNLKHLSSNKALALPVDNFSGCLFSTKSETSCHLPRISLISREVSPPARPPPHCSIPSLPPSGKSVTPSAPPSRSGIDSNGRSDDVAKIMSLWDKDQLPHSNELFDLNKAIEVHTFGHSNEILLLFI
ncbi:hypothetical protein NPIL_258601 [Nephila pilipes]|uniref:Uncharacterized protein n=1 Tax=Nephila pilipes TaxID=299642 RepID=A0A8X6QLN0_NEPPI|nr:hypothetical protein NPIL_258601 [Nephila pilipes]